MSDTETPAAPLGIAAAKLRALVEALGDNRGPWYIENEQARPYPQSISNIGVPYVVASCFTDPSHPPTTAQYIAAMHPGVGRLLADWLGCLDALDPSERGGDRCGWCGGNHAADIARALLGGAA